MTQTATPAARLVVVGANHRSSSMSFRDRLFVEEAAVPAFLDTLAPAVSEAMVLCTGERIDVIAYAGEAEQAADAIVAALAEHAAAAPDDVKAQVYVLKDTEACVHVFRVAASLDSLVVGETQILNQMRDALVLATEDGRAGESLGTLIDAAGTTAERVFRETELGGSLVSLAAAAVQVARDLHGDLKRCAGLLIGGGNTSELIVEDLIAAGMDRLSVAHPLPARAEATARGLGGHTVAMDRLEDALAGADIVLSALGQTATVIDAATVKAAVARRRHKPIFLIDAGIPGDIDPAVEAIEDAFVYTLDDLEKLARERRSRHKGDAEAALALTDAAARAFVSGDAVADELERARAEALRNAGGDADTATRLLLDKVKSLLGKR